MTTHEMNLNPAPFELIKCGRKTVELRLFDEKRSLIKVGDKIIFNNTESSEQLTATVKALHRFASFAELYSALPLEKCGYTELDIDRAAPSDMDIYYPTERQAKYGVVGIEITLVPTLRLARADELETVLALYKSVLGTPFCVWNENYPDRLELNHDFETENLYVFTENDTIIGAVSVVPENELDELDCWRVRDGALELARIVISLDRRGKGLAVTMLSELISRLDAAGVPSIHLSAAVTNIPSLKTYAKLGFEIVGEADLFGGRYYLLEKLPTK